MRKMIQDFSELSGLQLDALKEIGNIGAGNAATALATMVQSKIDMTVPVVTILPLSDVPQLLGGAEHPVVAIYLGVEGDVRANILFVLQVEKALDLVDLLMGRPLGESKEWGDMERSAVAEVGNIIASTYLNALAMFTNLKLLPTVPAMGIDMAGALIDAILAQFGEVGEYVLVLETEFRKDMRDIVGHFLMLPEPGALDIILAALGVNT